MSKFRQKLIKGLAGILLAGASLFPLKAQERLIIDNYSQPNDSTLNWYGSGDINKDNTIDYKDAQRLDSLIQGTFSDTTDNRLSDRADINGDELINSQDKQTLNDYLAQNIEHLPAYWNSLDSLEKINWFEKMYKIDKTDTIALGSLCYEYTTAFDINFHGFGSLANGVGPDFPFKFSKNNRFNIPVYTAGTTSIKNEPHGINAVLTGDNPFDFNSWYFLEPQLDKRIYPGDFSMATNHSVKIISWDFIDPQDGGLLIEILLNGF